MEEEKQVTEPATEAAEAAGGDLVELADPASQLDAVTAERDQLAKERADLYDQLLRRTAEFENFRKRSMKERAEFAEFAGMSAVEELLPIVDDLERALKVETADKEYAKGMELIYQRLLAALKKTGLEPMVSEGQPFDPNMHHAVEMVTTEEAGDHTVLQELQRGYTFKGRLLRPAMVRVAVKG